MPRYAQIDSNGLCIAVSDLSGEVEAPHMIAVGEGDAPLGKRWNGRAFVTPDPAQRPTIVITAISAAAPHNADTMVAPDLSEVTLPVGATLQVTAELQFDGRRVRRNDVFRMPLVSIDNRHRVLLAKLADGVLEVRAQMTESRIWRITEADINAALPPGEQMAFAGLTVYAVEA